MTAPCRKHSFRVLHVLCVARRYTPRQIALLPGDAQHLVVVEADHNEFNQAEAEVCTNRLPSNTIAVDACICDRF